MSKIKHTGKNIMNNQVSAFLSAHNFVNHVDVLTVAQAILSDMRKGLKKEYVKPTFLIVKAKKGK